MTTSGQSREASPKDPRARWLPQRKDQQTLAVILVAVVAVWWLSWWCRGGWSERVDIDRVARTPARFAVDINRADWAELTLLPRIGPTLAQRIVASRRCEGRFRTPSQLLRVKGIGPATLRKIRPYLALPPTAVPSSASGELTGDPPR